jgi:hypothetical protein
MGETGAVAETRVLSLLTVLKIVRLPYTRTAKQVAIIETIESASALCTESASVQYTESASAQCTKRHLTHTRQTDEMNLRALLLLVLAVDGTMCPLQHELHVTCSCLGLPPGLRRINYRIPTTAGSTNLQMKSRPGREVRTL